MAPWVVAVLLTASAAAAPGRAKLLVAVAGCDVAATEKLLSAGADPNEAAAGQASVVHFLASRRQGCSDADALAVAKLLAAHAARFDTVGPRAGPNLLAALAPRHLPQTLAYVATRPGAGEPSEALRAIAGRDDVDSVKVLLAAGADPIAGSGASALFDAARAGQAASVTEMLQHVHDLKAPPVLAAYEVARADGGTAVVAAFTARGFVAPAPPATRQAPCARRELSADERALLARVGIPAQDARCRLAESCAAMILVDCDSAADGPAYYIDTQAEKVLATCGGACMRGCTNCPPAGWTCDCRL